MECDITAIILTYNEEIHLQRCIDSLKKFVKRICIVDSYSNDKTLLIANEYGVDVYQNRWVNYANQFQWGLDNLNISTKWTMRVDADEYFENSLIDEILHKIPQIENEINAIYLKRKVLFKGKWIKYGNFYPHILLRIWRTGLGRIEQRWMDEHIVVKNSVSICLKNDFVDDNKNNIGWWIEKHNNYSTREMVDLLNIKYKLFENDSTLVSSDDPQAKIKRIIKQKIYAKLPIGGRAFLYFCYRYFLRLGFLDGWRGFVFHFMQGFWYRLLVDVKVYEIEKLIMDNPDIDVRDIIKEQYKLSV